jgi:succinoglycan biosynthesis protein ExoM
MSVALPHICVCVCTYKRPEFLSRLLCELARQDTAGAFTYSIVIVDNDQLRSAEPVVGAHTAGSAIPIRYHVEPRQNIALARNKAVLNAHGDFIAFIDDDEFPVSEWLLCLFSTLREYGADGVLGPVKPYFRDCAPGWVREGGFYERPLHPTGMRLVWSQCRTGNALIKSAVFTEEKQPFNPECLSGEDLDFFKRLLDKGRVFLWCNEATAYEDVPPARCKRFFLIRRALFKGFFSLRHRRSTLPIATSLIAAPTYAVAAPFAFIFGQAQFMKCVFKSCYHAGRLLSLVGINPIKGAYVTD